MVHVGDCRHQIHVDFPFLLVKITESVHCSVSSSSLHYPAWVVEQRINSSPSWDLFIPMSKYRFFYFHSPYNHKSCSKSMQLNQHTRKSFARPVITFLYRLQCFWEIKKGIDAKRKKITDCRQVITSPCCDLDLGNLQGITIMLIGAVSA